jgi:hypothetical protein
VEATFVSIRPDHHLIIQRKLASNPMTEGSSTPLIDQVYHCPKWIEPREKALQINRSHPREMFEMFLFVTKAVRLSGVTLKLEI